MAALHYVKSEVWYRVARWYGDQLEEFVNYPATPTVLAQAQHKLNTIHAQQRVRETDVVWQIKPKLVYDSARFSLEVEPDLMDLSIELI